ncbi:MAG: UDP-N-acetylmuramate--L-alanine ligase [Anaerolineae bacterium]|nr:UDP-N-acetylmuramate--L-alanine ligase [Anaerolineae bacterium]
MIGLEAFRRIHVVGIGGAGMSAIARVLHARGFAVRGSDRSEGRLVALLRAEGIPVVLGHAAGNVAGVDLVLASSAIPEDNVELVAARSAQIPVMRRPEFLPLLLAGYDVIAIAGAHGKTTVTGMTATILLEAGLDPSYIIGGVTKNLETNARAGQGKIFVIEADEYQNTFLALEPAIAVVTNVEFDHPDCFPSARFLRLAFGQFVDRIRPGGRLIACSDDAVAHALGASHHANGGRLLLYGQHRAPGLAWLASDIEPNALGGVSFTPVRSTWSQNEPLERVQLSIPGTHNAVNALAALAVAAELDVPFSQARVALEKFSGTAGRFEVLGEAGGVTVVDDYAHHPTQIQMVLAAARQRYGQRRIVAVWQPHTFSRVRALWGDFVAAFDGADHVLVLPIYAAREVDDGTVRHTDIAQQMVHPSVEAVGSLEAAVACLRDNVAAGDVVLLMGAGTEYIVGRDLLAILHEEGLCRG